MKSSALQPIMRGVFGPQQVKGCCISPIVTTVSVICSYCTLWPLNCWLLCSLNAAMQVEDVLNRCEQNLLQLGDELDRQATTSMRIFENALDAYGDSFDCFHLKFPAKVGLQKGRESNVP